MAAGHSSVPGRRRGGCAPGSASTPAAGLGPATVVVTPWPQAPAGSGLDAELGLEAAAAAGATEPVVVRLVAEPFPILFGHVSHAPLGLPPHRLLAAHSLAVDLAVAEAELITGWHGLLLLRDLIVSWIFRSATGMPTGERKSGSVEHGQAHRSRRRAKNPLGPRVLGRGGTAAWRGGHAPYPRVSCVPESSRNRQPAAQPDPADGPAPGPRTAVRAG